MLSSKCIYLNWMVKFLFYNYSAIFIMGGISQVNRFYLFLFNFPLVRLWERGEREGAGIAMLGLRKRTLIWRAEWAWGRQLWVTVSRGAWWEGKGGCVLEAGTMDAQVLCSVLVLFLNSGQEHPAWISCVLGLQRGSCLQCGGEQPRKAEDMKTWFWGSQCKQT